MGGVVASVAPAENQGNDSNSSAWARLRERLSMRTSAHPGVPGGGSNGGGVGRGGVHGTEFPPHVSVANFQYGEGVSTPLERVTARAQACYTHEGPASGPSLGEYTHAGGMGGGDYPQQQQQYPHHYEHAHAHAQHRPVGPVSAPAPIVPPNGPRHPHPLHQAHSPSGGHVRGGSHRGSSNSALLTPGGLSSTSLGHGAGGQGSDFLGHMLLEANVVLNSMRGSRTSRASSSGGIGFGGDRERHSPNTEALFRQLAPER